ncbi:MAG: T9SS type A sorting domain-containing protein [Ignavibacteria bacterium]|nr:T9SS type A sorting domain-containing protein [Ignavibacteria bacterium]
MKNGLKIFLKITVFIIFFTAFKTSISYSQLVNDFRVNDDTTQTIQEQGKVGVDSNGNFVVVWTDTRTTPYGIYCQKFNNNGQKTGNNFLLISNASNQEIAVRKDGSFGMVFSDTVPKFRLFNNTGIPISDIIILDSLRDWGAGYHHISCDTSGTFVIVHEINYTPSNINIYYQLIDASGNRIGSRTRVNDDTTITGRHTHPVVTKRRDGSFIAAWQDPRPPSIQNGDDIYMQMYDKFGNKTGNNVRVNNDTVLYDYQHLPKISSDDSGRFCIVFIQIEDNSGDAYNLIQLYNADGTPNGNNFRFSNGGTELYPQLCKRKNGDMVISFEREAGTKTVPYMQRMTASGLLIGSPFLVTNQYPNSNKGTSSIAIFNDKIITIFVDDRLGSFDIYCNIRSFNKPDSLTIIRQVTTITPGEYKLYQNYPNPFNPVTTIKFSIGEDVNLKPETGLVTLKVYDVLGKEAATLVNEKLRPGTYEVPFSNNQLPSGIYFYRLTIDNKQLAVKKMMMIK